jgi:Flp pilus assembly pilin Flp
MGERIMKLWVMLQMMLQDRRGIAAVEYAVLVAVVGGAVYAAYEAFDLKGTIKTLLDAGTTGVLPAAG